DRSPVPSVRSPPTSAATPGKGAGSAAEPAGRRSRSATCGSPRLGTATTRSPLARTQRSGRGTRGAGGTPGTGSGCGWRGVTVLDIVSLRARPGDDQQRRALGTGEQAARGGPHLLGRDGAVAVQDPLQGGGVAEDGGGVRELLRALLDAGEAAHVVPARAPHGARHLRLPHPG